MKARYPGVLYIDGVKVPTPQSYEWNLEDVDGEEGTGRNNATGEMFRDRITTKIKLIFSWPPMSIADTSRLLKALRPVFVEVRYLDALEGGYVTKMFYAGPQSATCDPRDRWTGVKANLIEK